MKSIKYILFVIIGSLFLTTCTDIESLKRDNPLDGKDNQNNGNNNGNKPKSEEIKFNSYTVYSDNNGNGIVNPGETVSIKVSLKNTGSSKANKVKATFSTTSTYISGLSPTRQINYGDISPNAIKWATYYGSDGYANEPNTYTIMFTVLNTTPIGTEVQFNISIVDESGNTWTDSFNVPVQ